MYPSILTEEQKQLLPFVKACGQRFYLVGGTAVALQIGHRKSIDFDLFSSQPLNKQWINKVIKEHNLNFIARFQDGDQLTGMVNSVQITFYEYPYDIEAAVQFEDVIFMPDLLTLAAMKAFALGMRAKWKDYVDLYFIFRDRHDFTAVADKAESIFGGMFNRKLFRQQLSYYEDVNYKEKVEYLTVPIADDEIKRFLTDVATQKFGG